MAGNSGKRCVVIVVVWHSISKRYLLITILKKPFWVDSIASIEVSKLLFCLYSVLGHQTMELQQELNVGTYYTQYSKFNTIAFLKLKLINITITQ